MGLESGRNEILEKLIKSYRRYYNINMMEEAQRPLVARCDYYEHNQKYVLSKKAELWSTDAEEFLYLFDVPHLTTEIYESCMKIASENGMNRLNIGPGHMCSYITALIVCDSADEDAVKTLKKSRIYKSFHFSLYGWMDYRAALVVKQLDRIEANGAGRCLVKILKKVLYSKEEGRE